MKANPEASRGVLYPASLPSFHREPAKGDVAAFVRWFWIPEWNIEPGRVSRQHVIGFPACNLVVSHSTTEVTGPQAHASYRDLTGRGWAVGALLRPAAIPELVGDASVLCNTSREIELPELSTTVRSAMNTTGSADERHSSAVRVFTEWLLARLEAPSDEALLANRMAEAAECDMTVRNVADLAAHLNISIRSMQRLASKYVGISPAFLIRRRRLQEAAEKLRLEPSLDLTVLAHETGYADHAHLTRDFRAHLGFTPSGYRGSLPAE